MEAAGRLFIRGTDVRTIAGPGGYGDGISYDSGRDCGR